jgi:hypothetical protein
MIRCFFFHSTSRAESKNWIFNLCISKPWVRTGCQPWSGLVCWTQAVQLVEGLEGVVRKNRASQPNCRSHQPAHNWQILYKKTYNVNIVGLSVRCPCVGVELFVVVCRMCLSGNCCHTARRNVHGERCPRSN